MGSSRTKPKLSRAVMVNITLIAAVAILSLGALQILNEYRDFTAESRAMRNEYLANRRALLKEEVSSVVDYIDYMRRQTRARLRESIRGRVEEAMAIAGHILKHYGPRIGYAGAKDMVREALRPIRFNHGRGYFFAFDLNGIEQLFADRPEMEGRNMLFLKSGRGEYVVRDMLGLARRSGGGFYEYAWTKPGAEGDRHAKIAYVKLFKPLNWVIGTGEYLADVEADIQAEALAWVEKIRYGGGNYIFVSDWDGATLTGPNKGRNNLEITDVNGVKIVKELISLAQAGGGFLTYVLPKFKGLRPATKLSYVAGLPEWRWYVGTGIYVDEIESEIAARRRAFRRSALIQSGVIASILGLMIGLAYLLARRFADRARADYNRFEEFFSVAGTGESELDAGDIHFAELASLAESANQMVEARRKGEAAEQTLERFFQLSVDLLCIADLEGRFIRVNPAFEHTLGYPAAQLIGHPYLDFVHPEDREAAGAASAALAEGRPVIDLQSRYLCADGSYRWLSWTEQPVPELGVSYAIARDITRQKEIEQELRSLADIAKLIPTGLFIYRFEPPDRLVLVDSNPEATKQTGLDPNRERGREFNEIWPRARAGGVTKHLLEVARTGRPWEIESVHYRDQRVNAFYRLRAFPLPGGRVCTALEDISALKQAESEQVKLQNLLHQAQKMEAIGTLAGGIAHDFNNILAAILGYTELSLDDFPEDGPVRSNLQQVYKSALRARDLVKQILSFSRRTEHETKPLRLEPIVKETLKLLRATIPTTIDIEQEIAPDLDPVEADPTQIHQLILNLGSNAADAMREDGGAMTVRLRNAPAGEALDDGYVNLTGSRCVKITVQDTGQGIPPEIKDRIFEPFFTTKEVGAGTGMGLSVVHGIIKSLGGTIKVDSGSGRGARFTIYLPVVEAEAAPSGDETDDSPLRGTGRVLFVDDEPAVADVTELMLIRLGYTPTKMTDSLKALEAFKADPDAFDLVITDMAMPRMSGEVLSREVLAVRPDIPVILCTGYSDRIDEDKARALGISRLLNKPLSLADVGRAIRRVLDQKDRA